MGALLLSKQQKLRLNFEPPLLVVEALYEPWQVLEARFAHAKAAAQTPRATSLSRA